MFSFTNLVNCTALNTYDFIAKETVRFPFGECPGQVADCKHFKANVTGITITVNSVRY